MEAGPAKYQYRSVDDVLEAVHPVFAKHGIVMAPEVIHADYVMGQTANGKAQRQCTMHVRFRFYGPEGDCIEAVTIGESLDTSDKASNKAHTAALKVALCQVLLIPYDSQDPDDHQPDRAPADKPKPSTPAKKAAAKPASGKACPVCSEPLGNGEPVKRGPDKQMAHTACLEKAPAEAVAEVFPGTEEVKAPASGPADYSDEPF